MKHNLFSLHDKTPSFAEVLKNNKKKTKMVQVDYLHIEVGNVSFRSSSETPSIITQSRKVPSV